MAIEDNVILPAGTHVVYSSRKSARSFHTTGGKKGGNFSLHHIIPYRYPCFVGMLVEKGIAEINRLGSGGENDKTVRSIKWWLDSLQKSVLPRSWGTKLPEGEDLRHDFAWMGANLFTGPSGVWRLYDPGSAPEPLRPQSFPVHQWTAIHDLGTYLDGKVVDWIKGADEGEDAASTSVTVGDMTLGTLTEVLTRLSSIAGYKDAHPFTGEDWLIVSSRDARWRNWDTKLNSHMTSKDTKKLAKKTLEGFAKDEDFPLEYKMPISHNRWQSQFPDLPWMEHRALWRLRREDERVPKMRLTANFILQ